MRSVTAFLVALSLLSLTACSRPAAPPATATGNGAEPAPPAQTAVVRMLYWPADEGLVNALTAAFYQQNAQIRIEKVLVDLGANPNDRTARIKTQATTGEIDLIPTSQLADLDRLALPLDDRLQAAGMDLKPYGSLLDVLRINRKLYQLPYAIYPAVILYNPDLLSEAGAAWPAPGWTWDDMRLAGNKVTGLTAEGQRWGLASVLGNAIAAKIMATERFGAAPVDPEQARQILQYWEALVRQDRSAVADEPRRADGSTDQFDYFSAGRAGMSLAFVPLSRFTGAARNRMFTPGMAPLPTWPGLPPSLYILQSSYAVAAGSKNPEAAWQVLQFMAGPEGAQVLAREGTVPAYRSDGAKAAWFEQSPTPSRSSDFLFSLPYMDQGDGLSDKEYKALLALMEALTQVVQGKATADDAYRQFMNAQ